MKNTINATEVRKNWGQFNDDVIRSGPRFVKRNRDEWAALNANHLKIILNPFYFEAEIYTEDDGTTTISLKDFDLAENAETEELAMESLTEEVIEYAEEYHKNFEMYYNSPNRRRHFPYVVKVLSQDNKENVKELIKYRYAKENTDDFSEEILSDLIQEGYEDLEMLEEFKRRKKLIRSSVNRLIEEAQNQKSYESMDEMFDDKDN